jgi:hypothetical protein
MVIPPTARTSRMPAAPSAPVPESTTAITRSSACSASDRKKKSIG